MGINLSNREAARLFYSWGFIDDPNPGNTGGHHYFRYLSADGPKCTITNPGRGTPTPRKAFIKGAEIVGVPLKYFLMGPEKAKTAAEEELAARTAAEEGPDPLGLRRLRPDIPPGVLKTWSEHCLHCPTCRPYAGCDPADLYMTGQIPADTEHYFLPPATEETSMPMSVSDEKVLGVLIEAHEPLPRSAIAEATGLHDTSAGDALRRLEKEGVAFKVGKTTGTGRPATLWWHRETYLQPDDEPATAPEPDPTPEETPVHALPTAKDDPDFVMPDVTQSHQKLFTATGTPWPTGGVLIQDEDGVLYVARKLVEEGR